MKQWTKITQSVWKEKIAFFYEHSMIIMCFFFQAEDGIRDFCLSRGLGDVYKRQGERDRRIALRGKCFRCAKADPMITQCSYPESVKCNPVSYTHLTLPTTPYV